MERIEVCWVDELERRTDSYVIFKLEKMLRNPLTYKTSYEACWRMSHVRLYPKLVVRDSLLRRRADIEMRLRVRRVEGDLICLTK